MSALDPNTARRLRASLLLLNAPTDGERLAAVSAVSRLLARNGLTLADLAAGLGSNDKSQLGKRQVFCREAWHLAGSGFAWDSDTASFLEDLIHRAELLSPTERERLNVCHRRAPIWRAREHVA